MRKSGVFPVLACFALVFCDYASAVFRALAQESPVVVAVGDMAVLRSRTSVPNELIEVRWIRIQDGRYSIINIFEHGRDQQRCDLPEYIGRTEVMREGLTHGRAALKLFNVSVADDGTYRCYLETVNYFDFGDLELRVTDGLFRKGTDVPIILLVLALVCSLAAAVIICIFYTCLKNEQGTSSEGNMEMLHLKVALELGRAMLPCLDLKI